jgi:hypothetical protein
LNQTGWECDLGINYQEIVTPGNGLKGQRFIGIHKFHDAFDSEDPTRHGLEGLHEALSFEGSGKHNLMA